MRKHRHISLIIAFLAMPCFGQFSEIWTNGELFKVNEMASQCYSASVERCVAVGVTPDDPSWYDYLLGKNHAKLASVKANISACVPYYLNYSLADANDSFTNYLATGSVSGLSWSNSLHFLSSCGLPTNSIDETPWFKSQYPSQTGGWVSAFVMLTNLVVSKQDSQWWVNDQGNTNLFSLMGYFSQYYDTEYYLPYETMEIPNAFWDSASTAYVANARGAYHYYEMPTSEPRPYAHTWGDCVLGITLALTQPDYSLWPNQEAMYGMKYPRNYYHQLTYGTGHITKFNPYMRLHKPHLALGASAFYYGGYVSNYFGGTSITSIVEYTIPINTSYSVITNVYDDFTNDFFATGTVYVATNFIDHYQTNLGLFGSIYMGSIHTDTVAVLVGTNMDIVGGTNGEPYIASFTNIYGESTYSYAPYYVTNSESTNFYLVIDDPAKSAYRGLKSQLSGIPYAINRVGVSNRVDFYENIQPPQITNLAYGTYDYPSMDHIDQPASMYAVMYYQFTNFGFNVSQGWRYTQKSISESNIVWGEYYGTNNMDYIVDALPLTDEPAIGYGYSKGWEIVDNFAAVWWNVTNGFKYR